MGERRVLVIGSQCQALGETSLAFLPRAATDLATVLLDPNLGACKPALEDGTALLLNPTLTELDDVVKGAVSRASRDEATLFVAFIGHGDYAGKDFYLLPLDSTIPPNSRTGFLLAQRLLELLREYDQLDGLVLLVDTCHAAVGAFQAGAEWPQTVAQSGGRFEVLTASDHREAYDGCFTKRLIEVVRSGESRLGESLRCGDIKMVVQHTCEKQVATYFAFDGRDRTHRGDEGLWLARNADRRHSATTPLSGTPAWAQVERLTAYFQRTPDLNEVVRRTDTSSIVALLGPAGQGKSTLAAALFRADLADDILPARFAHALLLPSSAQSSPDFAFAVAEQLALMVKGFSDSTEQFRSGTPEEVWAELDPWERRVLGPLRLLPSEQRVRIVVDGLDQFSDDALAAVQAALDTVADDPALSHMRLVVTARHDTALPHGVTRLILDRVDDEYVKRYMHDRGIPESSIDLLVERAAGNWLIARLLADLILDGVQPAEHFPSTLEAVYWQELHRAGWADFDIRELQLRPVLAVLAVAGVGPVLPIRTVCAASGRLGGPDRPGRVRDVLVRLRGLVVRSSPGTPREQVGLFHATLAEYLLNGQQFGIDLSIANDALADALDQLDPMERLTMWFQHTSQLDRIVDATRSARSVAVVGPAGQGKSTLAAALAHADLANPLIPGRFVNALVFCAHATTAGDLAGTLAEQLSRTVHGFPAASSAFRARTKDEAWARLDPFDRQLIGPLRLLSSEQVRIVVDALDQLPRQAVRSVQAAFRAFAIDPELAHVRLVVTARPDTPLPPNTQRWELDRVDDIYLERYLQRRGVTKQAIPHLIRKAAGNWLVARLLADLATEAAVSVDRLPTGLADAYRQELVRAGRADPDVWQSQLRPVLVVLAAAPVGPALPLRLLGAASEKLGGPERLAEVRDVLVRLRGLVKRGNPGTPREQVGLFHATLADYLLGDPELGIDPTAAHATLADAIAELAAMDEHDPH